MIEQVFHLSNELLDKIEKPVEESSDQLLIEKASDILRKECRLDYFTEELEKISSTAETILNKYNKAIVIGMGGSSLASRAFTATENYKSHRFNIIYSDSLSYKKQAEIFTKANLASSAIIIISRSGNSIETLSQTSSIIQKYKEFFDSNYSLGEHFFIITYGDNKLSQIGKSIKATLIDYNTKLGKFSSFSIPGLLPSTLINLSPTEIIEGALAALNMPINALKAAKASYYLLSSGYSINVLTYYNDLFDQICAFYSQVSSEIIAKSRKGFTPLINRSIFDQHGLWQLLIEGQNDKYFTILRDKNTIDNLLNKAIEDNYHLLTVRRFKKNSIPMRELILDSLSAKNLGFLVMQFLMELVLLASYLEVSPLTHPIIEQNKRLMNYLIPSILE